MSEQQPLPTASSDNNIEVDVAQQEADDQDEGFEDSSVLTQSLRSSIYAYKEENGRRYHAYKEGAYFMPNDDAEQDRLLMQHRAMFLAAGGELHDAPLAEPVQNILDLGTGIGVWAVEMADKYPTAQVIGVDLSPIQPTWIPPNVKFEVDDVEDNWTWDRDKFDLIYSQFMLSGSISDTKRYFRQAYDHCKPGGYFEIHDLCTRIRSDHAPIPSDSHVDKWCALMREAILVMNRHLDLDFAALADDMREVGFVDVVNRPFKIPIGSWPLPPSLKEAGQLQLLAMTDGIEALTLALFTRCLGWSVEAVQVFLVDVRKEFCRKSTPGKGGRGVAGIGGSGGAGIGGSGDGSDGTAEGKEGGKEREAWGYTYWPCAVIYGRKPGREDKT